MNDDNFRKEQGTSWGQVDQAASLRDQKKIIDLSQSNNLEDPSVAFDVYEQITKDPYYFETETGKKFLRNLLKVAIRSNSYIYHEEHKMVKKESPQAVKEKKQGKKKWVIYLLAILCAGVLIYNCYKIIEYRVLSYISQKKIEELVGCILTPIETSVSEENRMDDMHASGQTDFPPAKEEEVIPIKETEVLYKYSTLYERNHDMVGWIHIEDTLIQYPVMQTKEEEEYYLLRDFDRNKDINGMLFMDARCNILPRSTNLIIYGHNMKNGSMFSHLLDYEEASFYEQHKTIAFDTIYETGIYDIVAVFQTRVAYQGEDAFRYYQMIQAKDEKEFDEYIENIKKISYYDTGITAEYQDELLTLSTCDRRINNGRFVVVAKKRK